MKEKKNENGGGRGKKKREMLGLSPFGPTLPAATPGKKKGKKKEKKEKKKAQKKQVPTELAVTPNRSTAVHHYDH